MRHNTNNQGPPVSQIATRCKEVLSDDLRCLCGRLLARVVDGQVELKCIRCKRTFSVVLKTEEGAPNDSDWSVVHAK